MSKGNTVLQCGNTSPSVCHISLQALGKVMQGARAVKWEKAHNMEPELSRNAGRREILRKTIIDFLYKNIHIDTIAFGLSRNSTRKINTC